jgi:DNA-binding response OmpR family regulator
MTDATVPTILIVDNNRGNLEQLARQLAEEGYATVGASSPEEMNNTIKERGNIRLGLLDLTGFDESIWERCDQMHDAGIPFIVIMPQRSPGIQRDSLKHGANGLLVKPLGTKELVEHIRAALGE